MSKNTLDVYGIGSQVKLTNDVFGVITGITIRGDNHVTYECGWWNGRSYDSRSFTAKEIEVTIAEKSRIGFA
jgi:uncharacterized protein YodC (DUF2158 family)